MIRIMVNRLLSHNQLSRRRQWLAAAGIPGVAWVRAARHLQANPVPLKEAVSGWPEIDDDAQAAISRYLLPSRRHSHQRVAHVQRFAGRIYVAQASEEIGVLETGAREQLYLYRPDHLQVLLKRGSCVGQDIRSRL